MPFPEVWIPSMPGKRLIGSGCSMLRAPSFSLCMAETNGDLGTICSNWSTRSSGCFDCFSYYAPFCIIHFLLHLHIKVDLYLVLRIYVSLSSPCTELIIKKRLRSPEYRDSRTVHDLFTQSISIETFVRLIRFIVMQNVLKFGKRRSRRMVGWVFHNINSRRRRRNV